ncbi:MAG: hypothetical protein RIR18_914 [Pseudomonadota bacterium]|jgi:DNA polymerase-3 subunit delta'
MINIEILHAAIWQQLQDRRRQLPHALLLTGHAGIGKFDLARLFVAGLLCESPHSNGTACGVCQACHWLSQGNHPDFRMLIPEHLQKILGSPVTEDEVKESGAEKTEKKASQQITIEQIRALDGFLSVGTHRQGLRVILVYPAEAMNRNTANAILKSLEEPPPSTLFLLVSSDGNTLLPTIRSRCQTLHVPMPEHAQAVSFVTRVGGVSEKLASASLSLSGGAPLLAVDLAQHLEGSWRQGLFNELAKGGQIDVFAVAADLDKAFRETKEAAALRQTVDWVQKWVLDLSLACQQTPANYFTGQQETLNQLKKSLSLAKLVSFYRLVLLPLRKSSEHPVNTRLFLESLLAQYRALFA